MKNSQELVESVTHLLQNLKASNYLTDQFGNKIESITAIGEQLIQIDFEKNQQSVVEHISQFRCFIH